MVRIKNVLGDDIYGRWHIEKIVVKKHGQRYAIIPDHKAFSTKEEAERYAHMRTQHFVTRKLRRKTVRWTTAITTTALASVVTAVAIFWFSLRGRENDTIDIAA